jgi:hypothetical protein
VLKTFIISNVRAGNIILRRGQNVARQLRVERNCSISQANIKIASNAKIRISKDSLSSHFGDELSHYSIV